MTIDEFGWFTINILIPIFLPLLGVLPFKMMSLPEGVEVRFISLVKDGQWCWTAICIGTSSLYELWIANSRGFVLSEFSGVLFYGVLLLIFTSIGAASGGAVFRTPRVQKCKGYREWLSKYRLFVGSFVIVFLISYLSFVIHFSLETSVNF